MRKNFYLPDGYDAELKRLAGILRISESDVLQTLIDLASGLLGDDVDVKNLLLIDLGMYHPKVRAWLAERGADQPHKEQTAISQIVHDAYMQTLPGRGTCSQCGAENVLHVSPDLECPACYNKYLEALLERTRVARQESNL